MITKKYNELATYVSTLKPGICNLTIDATGMSNTDHNVGSKLNQAPEGVTFNVNFINMPDELTDASNMFSDCTGLTSIDTTAFTNVTNAFQMFLSCTGLTKIDTSAFTQVTSASWMFQGCTGLTKIDTSAFTNVKNANNMFFGCTGLTSINTSAFTKVTNVSWMFGSCTGLTSIDTSAFAQVTDAQGMFKDCTGLTSINTSAFTNVTDAYGMFKGCTGLTSINTSAFTNVTDASWMFYNCTGLTSIDTTAFTQVTNASYMFNSCTGLTEIILNTQAFNYPSAFYNCPIKVVKCIDPKNAENVKKNLIENSNTTNFNPEGVKWLKFLERGAAITSIGDINIEGNIYQKGKNYLTHAEDFYTKKDMIHTREGAKAALGDKELTGITAEHYDAEGNFGVLGFDKNGVARVGDQGQEQAIATREDSPKVNGIAKWNNAEKRFDTILETDMTVGNATKASDLNDGAEIVNVGTTNNAVVNKEWVGQQGFAKSSEIPSLSGYATETWVGQQGFAKSSEIPDVSGFQTSSQVESAITSKKYIPYSDEANLDVNSAKIIKEELLGNDKDLNSLVSSTYWGKRYYAGGGNTVKNKPSGVDAFGIDIVRSADGYTTQILHSSNTAPGLYYRTGASFSGNTAWKLLGQKGDTGATGFTWRPSVATNGDLTWTKSNGTTVPTSQNIKGPQGPVGPKGDMPKLEREGKSTTWINGRDVAIIKTTTYSGYDCASSLKTKDGSWEAGVYEGNKFYINYAADANKTAGKNEVNQYVFAPDRSGTVAVTTDIPTIPDLSPYQKKEVKYDAPANKYFTGSDYGINMNNSDIIGVNSIYCSDVCEETEGIFFKRTDGNYDRFSIVNGSVKLKSGTNVSGSGGTDYTLSLSTHNHNGTYVKTSGDTMSGKLTVNNDIAIRNANLVYDTTEQALVFKFE